MKIKALIAVRSGSQRVENKNIRRFAGSSLLEIKIKQLLRIKELDGVVVNSNDNYMLTVAKKMGCEVVERNPYYASNSVSMSEVYKNMASNFSGDVVVYTNVTNPLVKDSTIIDAISKFKTFSSDFDSLNSAYLVKEFLFEKNIPINYNLKKQPRSQDLPNIYALNFAVSIISRENMIKQSNVVGKKPFIYPMSQEESLDIDNLIDFEIAEFLYKKTINIK